MRFMESPINWSDSLWKQFSLVGDEEFISLSHAKVNVFSDSVSCLGKVNQNPASNASWEEKLSWFKDSPQYRTLDTIDIEPMEFEWNIFPGFTTLQLISKVQEFMTKMGDPSQFKGRIIFMSMFNDIIWGSEENERECNANATFVSLFAKRFPAGRWSFLGPGLERKWYLTYIARPHGEWDRVAELMMIKFRESEHPNFRSTSPLSRGVLKSKGGGNCQYTSVPMGRRLKLFFAQLFLSISSVFMEQSRRCVNNVILAMIEQGDLLWQDNLTHCLCQMWWRHTYLLTDGLAQEEDLLQRYQERIEKLSHQNRVIKICTDAEFLTTVEVGQYFMTKDTEEFSLYTEPVTCREYTLPRDEESTDPKGWIRGNTKIGPVLEVTTSYLQGKYGLEMRVESVTKTILTRGSEFLLMAWTSWSRTWATRRTTATSRRPLRRSRKNSRWKRMNRLLQADQRLKQNQEDLPLLAHLQELYESVKDFGLILRQELNRISLTQCQKHWLLFLVMVHYFEKKMERLKSED